MSVKVDPFIVPLPRKLASDVELGPYFTYLNKFLHDLWTRTGAGTDTVAGGLQNTGGTMTGTLNLTGSAVLQMEGTQVLTDQQAAVSDASAATASNPAAPAAYTPHASGAVPVLSNAATDLDTTAAALSTLRGEVATYETAISALIVDVASVRAQLNLALAALRTHGLIDT
jgi:hypothetical protein